MPYAVINKIPMHDEARRIVAAVRAKVTASRSTL